jgi:hypothetical protein
VTDYEYWEMKTLVEFGLPFEDPWPDVNSKSEFDSLGKLHYWKCFGSWYGLEDLGSNFGFG